jgi:hypothetical protein
LKLLAQVLQALAVPHGSDGNYRHQSMDKGATRARHTCRHNSQKNHRQLPRYDKHHDQRRQDLKEIADEHGQIHCQGVSQGKPNTTTHSSMWPAPLPCRSPGLIKPLSWPRNAEVRHTILKLSRSVLVEKCDLLLNDGLEQDDADTSNETLACVDEISQR